MIVEIIFSVIFNWVALMVVIPIASRIAGFSFPGFKEAAWKLAVVVLATDVISATLTPHIGIGARILALIVFFTAMVKWFDVNFIGAVVIVVLKIVVNILLAVLLVALFASVA